MYTIDCTVIVLGYNSAKDLPLLLDSLSRQTVRTAQVLLLDNASDDSTYTLFTEYKDVHNNVHSKRFETNIGFARAMNYGFSCAKTKCVCLLNSDTCLAANYLENCFEAFADPAQKVGMVTGIVCRLVDGQKTNVIDSLGMAVGRNRQFYDIGSGELLIEKLLSTTYPFGVSGCVPMYSRDMLDNVAFGEPPFVEMFGSYYEDIDLAWRARRAGFKAVCIGTTRAWHVREGSLTKRSLQVTARNRCHRNRYWTLLLNEDFAVWSKHLPYWIIRELFLIAKLFVQPGLIVAVWEMCVGIPAIMRLRKARAGISRYQVGELFSKKAGRYWRAALERRLRRFRKMFNNA